MSRRQDQDDRRGQEEAYARALDLFDSCRETKLEVDDNPTKVEVSHDGNRIFYGGETFGMLEFDTDGFVVPHGALFKNKISDINPVLKTSNQPADSKFQNSRLGDVLVGEFNTWNVLLYDQEMQELGRLNSKLGASNRLPSTYAQFKSTSKQTDSCLWYSGTQNLSVVNTTNYINNELNNFWMMQGKQVEPIAAHLSAKGDIVGIAKYDQSQHSLHYMSVRNTSTVLAYHRTDIFPYCNNWLCMDGSDRGDVFFIGGSSSMEQRGGTGYILAISLDENCDVVRWKEFPPATGVHAIQVLKTYSENIILAATHTSVIAFLWSNTGNFLALKQIPTGIALHDMVLSAPNQYIRAPVLYALGTDGVLRAYNFGRPDRGGKPIQMKPAKKKQKLRTMGEYLSVGQEPESNIIYTPANAERMSPADRRKARKIPPQNAQYYKESAIKQITVQDGGLGRIQAYDNERGIFTGSNGLRVLENRQGDYFLSSRPNNVPPFLEILLLPQTGELIIQEKSSGDLVKFDAAFKEVSRLKAVAPPDARVGEFYNSVHFGSERKYMWNRGDGSLGMVNTATFNQDIVPNFFAKQGEQSSPVTVVSDGRNFNKIVGVYNTEQAQFFVFVTSAGGLFRKKSVDINQRVPFVYTVENCNMEQGIFFAGGSTGDMQTGSAIIQAITFDQGLEVIDDLELKSGNGVSRRAVTMIARVPDRDVLFAATFQTVFVVEWTGTHFCVLNYVEDLHSAIPLHLCVTNPIRIYTGSSTDRILNRVDFRPN